MRRTVVVVAVVWLACGKGKSHNAPPTTGSGSESGSGSGSGSETGSDRAAAATALASLAFPEVAGHGFEKGPPPARVIATPSAIVVDGTRVVTLEAGVVPASALAGDHIAAVITGLSAPSREPRMILALDKTLSYQLLWQLVVTLKTQGLRSFGILARHGAESLLLPIDLPDASAASKPTAVESEAERLANQLAGDPAKPSPALGVSVEVKEASVEPASSLSGDLVKTKISGAYLANVKQCVMKAGPRDATPGGAIALAFTIEESGKASEPQVTGAPAAVASCITTTMGAWRFPVPRSSGREAVRVKAQATLDVAYHEAGGAKKPDAPSAQGEVAIVPSEPSLQLVVTVGKTDVIVWSLTGQEGTLDKPRARVALGPTAATEVGTALGDIVKRRWAGRARGEATRDIIVMPEPTTSMQTLVELLGAVRASADGVELFPHVLLSRVSE